MYMNNLITALAAKYESDIACAKANIEIYVDHPVGIGEHPDLISAIDSEMAKLCDAQDKLEALNKNFINLNVH